MAFDLVEPAGTTRQRRQQRFPVHGSFHQNAGNMQHADDVGQMPDAIVDHKLDIESATGFAFAAPHQMESVIDMSRVGGQPGLGILPGVFGPIGDNIDFMSPAPQPAEEFSGSGSGLEFSVAAAEAGRIVGFRSKHVPSRNLFLGKLLAGEFGMHPSQIGDQIGQNIIQIDGDSHRRGSRSRRPVSTTP